MQNHTIAEIESQILPADAREFLTELHRQFNSRRLQLLSARQERAKQIRNGKPLDFLAETKTIREKAWSVAPAPADLQDRRVEITGPADAKMIINALNSGAKVFMADLEDSLSPTWQNLLEGQLALKQAVRRTLKYVGDNGKEYKLQSQLATLLVRPRGLHFSEPNFSVGSEQTSGSLFDFGLYFWHNAKELIQRETGPYFYLPKMESHLEARWWNDVFVFAQQRLQIPKGTVRATCLIETINAAFEMEEFLYELREHASGLNAGRWDYIFSYIKKHNFDPKKILPDRAQVTMTTPFMNAYCQLLVQTCHKRGAHAIGGMAAFIPNRREPEVTQAAFTKVTADKSRESKMGFDGTWVAHPDLISIAQKEFDQVLGTAPHQKDKQTQFKVTAEQLLDCHIEGSSVTEAGVRSNINVALLYIDKWLDGTGAAGIHNLMEDAATAEISRSQLWQWVHHKLNLNNSLLVCSKELFAQWLQEESAALKEQTKHLQISTKILSDLVQNSEFADFLTTKSYETLRQLHQRGM